MKTAEELAKRCIQNLQKSWKMVWWHASAPEPESYVVVAINEAIEQERKRVVIQNYPVITVALGCSICGEVEHRNNYSNTSEWIKAAGEWAEKHRQSCGKIELRKQGAVDKDSLTTEREGK